MLTVNCFARRPCSFQKSAGCDHLRRLPRCAICVTTYQLPSLSYNFTIKTESYSPSCQISPRNRSECINPFFCSQLLLTNALDLPCNQQRTVTWFHFNRLLFNILLAKWLLDILRLILNNQTMCISGLYILPSLHCPTHLFSKHY